jgi:hypothetical protein
MEFILARDPHEGKTRYVKAVTELSMAFALAVPHEEALAIRDDVAFFQAVRAGFVKATPASGKTQEDLDAAVRQLVSRAVASDEVVDLFKAAGLKNPDISILSDEFLADVRDMPHRNLALELLQRLLNDEIKNRARKNCKRRSRSGSPALLVMTDLSPRITCLRRSSHPAFRTLARSRSSPARPYICRLIIFNRFTCPSTGPLLHF